MIEDFGSIAGVVVLYNSDISVLDNVSTYIHDVEIMYVIDNSDNKNIELSNMLIRTPSVKYHFNNGNRGIANALNTAAEMALKDGFDYLLTMDDDTRAPLGMIDAMRSFLKSYHNHNKVGIISAVHTLRSINKIYKIVDYTMTSGNLLSLKIYAEVGPFNESFFIDHVDHEYGIRLNSCGFEVIELEGQKLTHKLGNIRKVSLFGNTAIRYVSHNPIRNYYYFRNGFKLINKYTCQYPIVSLRLAILLIKEFTKVFMLEDAKRERFALIFKGIKDALNGNFGKYIC